MQTQQPMELGDYLAILWRRKWYIVIPFILILAASLVVAFVLPPVYKSEATLLIERQEIPQDLVETTITGFVEERIQSLSKQLLNRDNLWAIVQELDLYPDKRESMERGEILGEMRDAILVEMDQVQTTDPDTSRTSVATISFTISFEASKPETAKAVTGKLADLYLEENREARSEQAAQVSKFFEQEAKRLEDKIARLDKEIEAFKQENPNTLPQLAELNRRLYEQTEEEIERTSEEIRTLRDRINTLNSELAITDRYEEIQTEEGGPLLGPEDRLKALTAEYLRDLSRYSPEHPDMVGRRNEIRSLASQTAVGGKAGQVVKELARERADLSQARQQYSATHPDVKRLTRSVENLQQELQRLANSVTPSSESQRAPDNPRYVSLSSQLEATQGSLRAAQSRREQLQGKLQKYQSRLFETPTVERAYKELTRNYDSTRQQYAELQDKQQNAVLAQELETGSKAQRFTIVQSAYLPSTPERPNRLGIAMLGVLLAFSGGIGTASVAEYTDRTVRGSRGVVAAFQAPPLAAIPYIDVEPANNSRSMQLARAAASVTLVTLALVLTIAQLSGS